MNDDRQRPSLLETLDGLEPLDDGLPEIPDVPAENRQSGFYWIVVAGNPEPARWDAERQEWTLLGSDMPLCEDPEHVGPEIPVPATH